MKKKIFICMFFAALFASWAWFNLPGTESQILLQSRKLAGEYHYLAALELLDRGLSLYPGNQALSSEFKHDSELYIVHELSTNYQRIDNNPKDIQAYLSVSQAFLLAGDSFKALEALTIATFENPHSRRLWEAIANLENLAGRPLEAASALKEAGKY